MLNLHIFLIAIFLVCVSSAQHLAVVAPREPLPNKSPQSAAVPRRLLDADPDALFSQLVSADPKRQQQALAKFEISSRGVGPAQDVRYFAVNLDADEQLERVLIVRHNSDATALVLKKQDDVWWGVGSFMCCAPGGRTPEEILDLKQSVWYGTNDIVIRNGGSQGTGVGERRIQVYRMFEGKLYKVFDIVKDAYNMAGSESSHVIFPDANSSEWPRVIAVQRTEESKGRRKQTCVHYVWNSEHFIFAPTRPRQGNCR